MSTLWTVVPAEFLYFNVQDYDATFQEIVVGGATMLVAPTGDGLARIERLISPNPQDYLRPDWQPGSVIAYPHKSSIH